MSTTKFYHYNLWFEDDKKNKVPTKEIIGGNDLFHNKHSEKIIKSEEGRHYYLEFKKLGEDRYLGIIRRTKHDSEYFRKPRDGQPELLSEQVEGEGETGDIDLDLVHFGLVVAENEFKLLIEVGYQTPNIGIIHSYVKRIVDQDYEIEHEQAISRDTKRKMKKLLGKNLKSAEISFKSHPNVYNELSTSQTLKNITPEDYRLKVEVSLTSTKSENIIKIEDFIRDLFPGIERDKSIEDSIAKINLPKILHTFNIEAFEGEGNDVIVDEENLADFTNQEEFETGDYGIFDERLGKKMCKLIEEREN